ncbi:MAG: ABC transporter ATP-binding protein [Coriobacteriales bacterium]|nr:ABC transporter ATP-binding protein [Actinomycetes bacterium]
MSADARAGKSEPIIVAENLTVRYRKRTVLDVERFELYEGETHAVLGPSGSGKSTLLRVLGLLEKPATGRIWIDGAQAGSADREARLMMAAVFQNPYLFKGTVAENVAYGLKLRGVSAREREDRVDAALARVGLEGTQRHSALQLSGGEAQRVALARALVLEPRILLLDEPLSYLDPLIKRKLVADFSEILTTSGVSAIYVTHDQDEAMVVADRVSIMHEGRFVRSGTVDDVMGLPTDPWVADFIGMETALDGEIVDTEEGIARIMVGGQIIYACSMFCPGQKVLVGIRPEDVMLFAAQSEVPVSSARNRLTMRVEAIEPRGALVRVALRRDGLRLASSISRASLRDLDLEPGDDVTVLFKATAVHVAAAQGVPSRL